MKLTKPKFWKTKYNLISILLLPLSLIIIIFILIKKKITKINNFNIPIICVGNLFVGGTGKTPVSILIGKELSKMSKKPVIIKKFYKNQEDEHKLIKHHFDDLILKKRREVAINEAKNLGYDTIILDDGFQDYKIRKNLNILCFHANQLIGNGLVFPAGPLREGLNSIKDADVIIINGKKNITFEKKILNFNKSIEIIYSNYRVQDIREFKNKNLFAFAGIGNPENFFNLLSENNLKIERKLSFPDHYEYNKTELLDIINYSKKKNLHIVTTEKDLFRIKKFNLKEIKPINVDLEIEKKEKFIKKILNIYDKNF